MQTQTRSDTFVDALVRGCHPLHSTRALVTQLDACEDRDVERMADDLALSSRELRDVAAKGADAASLLPRRLAALHLDLDQIGRTQPRVLWDLQKLCTLCDSKRRCARDLASSSDSRSWQFYCPNYDTLSALKVQVLHISGTLSPRAASRLRLADAITRPEQRRIGAWLWALFFLVAAWIAVNSIGPLRLDAVFDRGSDLTSGTVGRTAADTAPAVTCLDTSCLDEWQQAILQTAAAIQEQGAAYSSSEQIAAAQRAVPELQRIRTGEAAACRAAGGTTSYGPMFQIGCTPGVLQSGRRIGYDTCRPMAAGGVCFLK